MSKLRSKKFEIIVNQQPGSGYFAQKALEYQGLFSLPDRKTIEKKYYLFSMERFKNLRIYYGTNNLKAGKIELNKKGGQVFKADPSKEWYVTYEFLDKSTGKYRPVFERRGINRIKSLSEKMNAAKILLDVIREELESGYNPLARRYESLSDSEEAKFDQVRNFPFKKALTWALEQKINLSKSTISTYTTNINYLSDAIDLCGYGNLPISLITKGHIKEAIGKLPLIRPNISAKGQNEYLTNVSNLLNILVDSEVLEQNPASGIRKLLESATEGFEPPTDEEFELIKKAIQNAPFGFRLYCLLIYQTGIRPKELNQLQVFDIDIPGSQIVLRGHVEVTKNKKKRYVPVTSATMELIVNQIGKSPKEFYPFGRDFECTQTPAYRNRYSEMWKKLVKDGLGINKDMYSLKHRGADDRQNDNDLHDDAIAHLFGHHSNVLVRTVYRKNKKKLEDVIRKTTPNF